MRIVGELLSDAALRGRLGNAGRQFVEDHFRWETRLQELSTVPPLACCLQQPTVEEAA